MIPQVPKARFKQATYAFRTSRFVDRRFQLKFLVIFFTSAMLGISLTVIPSAVLLFDNYSVFSKLAYFHSPGTLEYLEREYISYFAILATFLTGLIIFYYVVGVKLSAKIVGPVRVLKDHLRRLTRGEWSSPPVRIRKGDEFQELVDVYNYFYSSYQNSILRDHMLLERLKPDPKDIELYEAWKQGLFEKRTQLGLPAPPTVTFSTDDSSLDQPHVS